MTATERTELMQSLQAGLDANRELRKVLVWGERRVDRMLGELKAGSALSEVAEHIDLSEVRERISDALDEFERARHQVKVASFAVAKQEEMSIGFLSARWGISRQRGQRYAHEAAEPSHH